MPEKFTTEYNGVKIRNETDNIKLTKEMLKPDSRLNTKNILIYHTHTCESYTKTEKYKYKSSGNFRTTDINYSCSKSGNRTYKVFRNIMDIT